MKTCLYALSYLDGVDNLGSSRLERQIKYVNYYRKLKDDLGFQNFAFLDNASSKENLVTFLKAFEDSESIEMSMCKFHLPRGKHYDYPYAWRGIHFIRQLILNGYDKIICVDTDMFILTKKLAHYIRDCNSGWEAFWSHKYHWPTSELHILNKDKFDFFMGYTSTPWDRMNGQCQELALPFTKITKSFWGDRYGELRVPQSQEQDYYGQCPVDIHLEFAKYESRTSS